jgi:DNA-binding response OmpR family regulator
MSFFNAGFPVSLDKRDGAQKFPDGRMGKSVTAKDAFMDGKRCLVLEDEFLIALDLQQMLETAGAAVSGFNNTEAALAALNGGAKFAVGILDIRLGTAKSGLSVAAALAAMNIPFVFLTGMDADSADFEGFPDREVVQKPYQLGALMAALRAALASNDEKPAPDRTE